ncbi:MAG: hypothetical protein BGN88_02035 [Clostridiales bacterium 43-6]|nr:MAG: hypothetical protein BGN88_02035 [Clostridiales bacterium 43-6]
MAKSFIEWIVGDLDAKREYKKMKKRVNALPKEYRFAFRKIEHYMYSIGPVGGDMSMFADLTLFTGLVDLFEASVAEGRQVLDVIGSDISRFSDELMRASGSDAMGKKLNQEVMERLNRGE